MKISFKPFVLDVYGGMPANTYMYLFKHIFKVIADYENENYAGDILKTGICHRVVERKWLQVEDAHKLGAL